MNNPQEPVYLEMLEMIAEEASFGVVVLCAWADRLERDIPDGSVFLDAKGHHHTVRTVEPEENGLYVIRFSPESLPTLGRTFRDVLALHGDRLFPEDRNK